MKLFLASLMALMVVGIASASDPQPTCTLTATPSVIWPGEAVTLTWDSTNAGRVYFSPDIPSGANPSGSVVVHPGSARLYTMIALSGPGLVNDQGLYAHCKASVSVRSNTAP